VNRTRIIILTGNHVCHNPRAFKEAEALAEAGYEILWLGGWFDRDRAERDRRLFNGAKWKFRAVSDWTSSWRGNISHQRQRIRRRFAAEALDRLKIVSPWQLGYNVTELLRAALAETADLYIAHSESAIWVAAQLLKHGKRIGVDMEDWFSEDLPVESRKGRPISLLKELEKTVLTKSVYKTCPSEVMSKALAETYQCEPPTVIYNAFPYKDRQNLDGKIKERRSYSTPSVHWFSQSVGTGRGLEDLFRALPFVTGQMEIHLRGAGSRSIQSWIETTVPPKWQDHLFLHPVVHNDELLSRVAEHDIGLALEPKEPPNRNLAATNKLMQYLLAGLAVIASDTAGHREVADKANGALMLYKSGDAESLALVLNRLIECKEAIKTAKQLAIDTARRTFCWENTKGALINAAARALK